MQFLVAGHYCHDTLIHPEGTHRVLGGSVAYACSVLEPLGAEYAVISKVGEDFLYSSQVARPARAVAGAKTTSFVDDYRGGERSETLEARCEEIHPADIAGALAPGVRAEAAMACPIAGEIPPETLLELRRRSRLLVCDVQGLVRVAAPGQKVAHAPLRDTPFLELLDQIDYLKVGASEASYLDLAEVRRRTRILLTQDEQGCTLIDSMGETKIAPFHAPRVVDSTGAGDCFLTGFAYGMVRGWGARDAAHFGNLCGSLAVQHVGIPRITPEELRFVVQQPHG